MADITVNDVAHTVTAETLTRDDVLALAGVPDEQQVVKYQGRYGRLTVRPGVPVPLKDGLAFTVEAAA